MAGMVPDVSGWGSYRVPARLRLALWLLSCGVIVGTQWPELRDSAGRLTGPAVVGPGEVLSWTVLGLCLLWLWPQRRRVIDQARQAPVSPAFLFLGAALITLSLLMPFSVSTLLFALLLGFLGAGALFFGRAVLLPGALLGVYGFTIVFPAALRVLAGPPYSAGVAWVVVRGLGLLGFPFAVEGQVIHLSPGGFSVFINEGCAGHFSLGIFGALFALMMLDRRLPGRRAAVMLVIGVAGTMLQNLLRLAVLLLAGHYFGQDALWTAHEYAGYVIFPLWYGLFAYLYLRQARSSALS